MAIVDISAHVGRRARRTEFHVVDRGVLPDIDKHPTWWHGQRGPGGAQSKYTPLTSLGDYIYMCENTATFPGSAVNLTGRVAKIRKSDHVEVDAATLSTAGGDHAAGHQTASIGVSGAGTVIGHTGQHAAPLDAFYMDSSDLSGTIEAVPVPTGATERADYRTFYRSPSGDLYLTIRGQVPSTTLRWGWLYKWNESTEEFDIVGNSPFAATSPDHGYPAIRLAWSGGVMYALLERAVQGSGWPYPHVGMIKSTDGGTTWTNLTGDSVTLPASQSQMTTVFGGTGSEAANTSMFVDSQGRPVVSGAWNAGSGLMRLHVAVWDPAAEEFRTGELNHKVGDWNYVPDMVGTNAIFGNGHYVFFARHTGHGHWPLMMYVGHESDDFTRWDRWTLDATGDFAGAHTDFHSLEDDGIVRITPVSMHPDDLESIPTVGDPLQSEIWEFPLPPWGES